MINNLDYGIIGNCKSAALISKSGSIDWFCLPKFDSASVFAHLLDEEKGGRCMIHVENLLSSSQHYLDDTAILVTNFKTKDGEFDLIDFMPRYFNLTTNFYYPPDLIRYFHLKEGTPKFSIEYNPQLEYAQYPTILEEGKDFIRAHTTNGIYSSLYLYSNFNFKDILNRKIITLKEDGYMLISYNQKLFEQNTYRTKLKLERTKVYWLNWSDKTKTYKNKYNQTIKRSALTLKLLSYQNTGAIIAALTTSIPETIGDIRNWDYRFCWIRDASMVVRVLSELGHENVAQNYMHYIINMLSEKGTSLQVLYGINGENKIEERILDHLAGYNNSRPVRIGNAAYSQTQNDIYGILMDVIYYHFKRFSTTVDYSEDLWTVVRHVARIVEDNWKKPDKGIWEIRNESKHFTFSKVLCWVAIDRATKIAELLHQDFFYDKWSKLQQEIRKDIETKAWNEEKGAYTQDYYSKELDASVLLMENYGFVSGKDERYRKTVHAIQKELEYNGLMYRYKNSDDFGQPKSAFTICSFWLAQALYKIGEKEAAIKRFEQLINYSNHLGLFSEDLDFESKRQLGNFPQAYSHLALIQLAIIISKEELSEEESIRENLS